MTRCYEFHGLVLLYLYNTQAGWILSINSSLTSLNGAWQVANILARGAPGRIGRYHFRSLCRIIHAVGLQYLTELYHDRHHPNRTKMHLI